MQVLGAVVVRGKEYVDNEMLVLKGSNVGSYGAKWRYAGDQTDDESCIVVMNSTGDKVFYGQLGLPLFVKWLNEIKYG
jgi:hypothetical protein